MSGCRGLPSCLDGGKVFACSAHKAHHRETRPARWCISSDSPKVVKSPRDAQRGFVLFSILGSRFPLIVAKQASEDVKKERVA
jgi:hypothetical protein